ncbi:hypothetical protein RY831_03895 [Noviherbaspirillum sp. CPCC 100848]|uniref:Uncharacterized protein n=1 Tax=Noviherbaspirillum album TaxID=3080276 RepID=A0ABU6J3T1_9BURK|nr:hypothetical protein [Noviherbaspirillum sp. CPCC 100848]MEC4718277.1 hypothetical protein [Noviherbaspirillum sp. CPCC 100848]
MLNQVDHYFHSKPNRISGAGRTLIRVGGFLFVMGIVGKALAVFLSAFQPLVQQPKATKTLTELYPTLPLWWVPETAFGFIGSGLLVVAGFCLVIYGQRTDRLFKLR